MLPDLLARRRIARRLPAWMGLAGVAGCAIVLLANLIDPAASLAAWLISLVFWSGLPSGVLLLLMMMRIVPGKWRRELGRAAQMVVLALPLVGLAAIPLLAGLGHFYAIVAAGLVPQGEDVAFRAFYLQPAFLILRDIGFFLLMSFIAYQLLRAWAVAKTVAICGLILFPLFDTVIATDWLITLDPHFHASGFGLYLLSIQVTIGLSALILMRLHGWAGNVEEESGEDRLVAKANGTDLLGALLLTVLLLDLYFSFMQYIITWSGNLPQGVIWYQRRSAGVWAFYEYVIYLPQGIGILLLLFAPLRRSVFWLSLTAIAALFGKLLEIVWLVLPAVGGYFYISLPLVVLAFISVGLTFCAFFLAATRYWTRLFPALRPIETDRAEEVPS